MKQTPEPEPKTFALDGIQELASLAALLAALQPAEQPMEGLQIRGGLLQEAALQGCAPRLASAADTAAPV